jgi:hypothetical protein
MARKFSASGNYAPGEYGPFAIDSFTNANTTALRLTITQTTPWPDVADAVDVLMTWSNGSQAYTPLPGVWRNRDGGRKLTGTITLSCPEDGVTSGALTLTANVTVDASVTLEAV